MKLSRFLSKCIFCALIDINENTSDLGRISNESSPIYIMTLNTKLDYNMNTLKYR